MENPVKMYSESTVIVTRIRAFPPVLLLVAEQLKDPVATIVTLSIEKLK